MSTGLEAKTNKTHHGPSTGPKFEKKKLKRVREHEGHSGGGHEDFTAEKKKKKLSTDIQDAMSRNPKAFSIQKVNKLRKNVKR